MLWDKQENRKR